MREALEQQHLLLAAHQARVPLALVDPGGGERRHPHPVPQEEDDVLGLADHLPPASLPGQPVPGVPDPEVPGQPLGGVDRVPDQGIAGSRRDPWLTQGLFGGDLWSPQRPLLRSPEACRPGGLGGGGFRAPEEQAGQQDGGQDEHRRDTDTNIPPQHFHNSFLFVSRSYSRVLSESQVISE